MKFLNRILVSIAILFAAITVHGAADDIKIGQKNSSNTAWIDRIFAPSASSLLGTDASKIPITLSTSSALDLIGLTRGSVLYRGASGWSILTPGTAGYVLTSAGAGADPTYTVGPTGTLPTQTGNSGNLLTTDGTDAAWAQSTPFLSSALASRAPSGGLYFPGVAGDRVTATLGAAGALGTDNKALHFRAVSVPTANPAADRGIFLLSPTGAATAARSLYLTIPTSGDLVVWMRGVTGSDVRTATVSGFRAAYSGRSVNITASISGSVLSLYADTTALTYTEATAGANPPAWNELVTSTYFDIGSVGSSGSPYVGTIGACLIYNCALSASDISALVSNGGVPDSKDQWGSQVAKATIVNGSFETDTASPPNSWTQVGNHVATAVADVTAPQGNNVVEIVASGAGTIGGDYFSTSTPVTLGNASRNRKYLFKFYAKSITGDTTLTFSVGQPVTDHNYPRTITTSWVEYTQEHSVGSDTIANIKFWLGGAGTVRIDNVRMYDVGCIAYYGPQNGTGTTWYDSSSNALNATLVGSVTWANPLQSVIPFKQIAATSESVGATVFTPATQFEVNDTITTSPRGIMSSQNSTSTDGARIHTRKGRGTRASPTTVVSGDMLGRWVGSGYDGTNYLEMAAIDFQSTGTVGSTRVPTKMVFSTATDAAPSVLTTALTIDKDQSLLAANDIKQDGQAARNLYVLRNTTSNTAGNNLTVQAGGATSGATDKDGGRLILAPGVSTGTAKSSVRIQRSNRAGSTGTADNSLVDGYILPSVVSMNAEGSVNLFEVALPSGGMCGGFITFQITATDGTDMQVHAGHASYAAVNKGGVYTAQITDEPPADDANAASSGAITDTWAITGGTNKVTISVTVACSGITANDIKLYYTLHNGSANAVTQL